MRNQRTRLHILRRFAPQDDTHTQREANVRTYQTIHMARGGGVHTVPKGESWINEMGGRVLSRHRTKSQAVAAGRRYAKREHVEHTIHNSDGVISEKNSYGNDPQPPRDGD